MIDTAMQDFVYVSNGTYRQAVDAAVIRYAADVHRLVSLHGMAFISVEHYFERDLCCARCGHKVPAKTIIDSHSFIWLDMTFTAECWMCGHVGDWKIEDRYLDKPPRGLLWSPDAILACPEPVTGGMIYYWLIDDETRDHVRTGSPWHLINQPKGVIDAVKADRKFQFAPETVHCVKPGHPWIGKGMMNDLRIGDLDVKQA